MPERPGAASVAVDVLVEAGDWPRTATLTRLVGDAVAASVRLARPKLAGEAEVSVVFTDDAHVQALNRRFRGKDTPTNVLSFPAAPAAEDRFGPLLGDIVLASETIGREAADDGLPLEHHVVHLTVHGFLHLLGYDHMDDAEAGVMEDLETAILATLGIADPYAAVVPVEATARRTSGS